MILIPTRTAKESSRILIANALRQLRKQLFTLLGIGVGFALICSAKADESYRPEDGCIPNEKVAGKIATIILSEIYGEDEIEKQRPLKVELVGQVWHIEGNLPKAAEGFVMVGGVAEIEIDKKNGKILRVSHGE